MEGNRSGSIKIRGNDYSRDSFTVTCYIMIFLLGVFVDVALSKEAWIGGFTIKKHELTAYLIAASDIFVLLYLYFFKSLFLKISDLFIVSLLPVMSFFGISSAVRYEKMRVAGIVSCVIFILAVIICVYISRDYKRYKRIRTRYIVHLLMYVFTVTVTILTVLSVIVCFMEKERIQKENRFAIGASYSEENYKETSDRDLRKLDIYSFKTETFNELSDEQKEYMVDMLARSTLDYLCGKDNYKIEIEITPFMLYAYGGYSKEDDKLICNSALLHTETDDDVKMLIDNIFHECYHVYQYKCIEDFNEGSELLYSRQIQSWVDNEKEGYNAGQNDFFSYRNQPIEASAVDFAQEQTRKMWDYIYDIESVTYVDDK